MPSFEVRTRVKLRWMWFAAFLLPVIWQLWIPPFTGLADNGDFAKVIGRWGLVPASPSEQDTFHFWIREWKRDAGRVWVSEYWGVEVLLAGVALLWESGGRFDMRWMGLVHAALYGCFAWLVAGKLGKNWVAGIVAVLAFGDAAYVTYFQSFYFDTAAVLGLMILMAAWWAENPAGMCGGAALLALSKGPHAPAVLLLAVLLLAARKWAWWPAAGILALGGLFMLSRTTPEYQATAYYNLAFFKLGPRDPQALDALKIRTEDRRLLGTHAFEPTSPAQDARWLRAFFPKGGYGNVLRYYASKPAVAASVMWDDLRQEAKQIRAENLGNYERATGKRYCTLSLSFGWWSAGKSWLFAVARWHVFLFVPLAAAILWREKKLRWLMAGLLAVGGYEFAVATLADALETYRHLLLFHLAYDWLAVLALITQLSQTPRYHVDWT